MPKLMYKGKPCNPVSAQGTGIRRGLADYEKQYEIQSEPGAQGNACEPSIQHPLSLRTVESKESQKRQTMP